MIGRSVSAFGPPLSQQPDRLFIGELVEIAIESAHSLKIPGGIQTHDNVGVLTHFGQRFFRCDGDGEDGLGRTLALNRDERGFGCSPCGKSIIDDDSGMSGRLQSRAVTKVECAAALEFGEFPLPRALEIGVIDTGRQSHVLVDDCLRAFAFDNGTERHFGSTRRTDLAH